MLTSYIEEMIGYYICGFGCNRSIIDKVFCVLQILKKNESIMEEYISYL
jgi:hypothetical protein